MKIALVNLYPDGTIARYLMSSYVLTAYLKEHFPVYRELSLDILNFSSRAGVPEICAGIIERQPDCVAYSCYIWNIEKILGVVQGVKDKIDATHILGGPEISLDRIRPSPDGTLADYYVIGEGERKFGHLVTYLWRKSQNLDAEFPGGVAHWQDGTLAYSEAADSITNLDEIPSVYLSGVLEDRLYSRQQAFLETQRGCRYRCRYCVYHKNLPSICYYSEPRVFQELDYLILKKQVMAIRIFDAIFTSDLPRAKRIAQHLLELKNSGVRLPWIYWEFTYRDVDEDFIRLVASLKYRDRILNADEIPPLDRAQFYSDLLKNYTVVSSVGVESFNKQSLKAVGRAGLNRDRLNAFMNMSREHNIALKVDLILGLPFETLESFFGELESFIPYFRDTDHVLNIHLLSILPGSALDNLCPAYEIKYSREAPHHVLATNGFSAAGLARASKLCAVLFRVLNSPLRRSFFTAADRTGPRFLWLLEKMLDKIAALPEFEKTKLVRNDYVDDDYWNDEIYREIPSQWLIDFLQKELPT